MITINEIRARVRRRIRARRITTEARRYWLAHDELLEYPVHSGMRAICHLLVYRGAGKPPVCIVGNFDEILGSSTSNVIDAVATAVVKRLGNDKFRLIQWFPHSNSGPLFSEVRLDRVSPSAVPHAKTLLCDGDQWQTAEKDTTVTWFANPRWLPLSDDPLFKLVGQRAVYELVAMAGLKGDYTPERLFDKTGRRVASEIRAHNEAKATEFFATLREGANGNGTSS